VAAAIDPDQPLPIYVQLKTLLLEEILGGRNGPGDQLPTEHELCAQYGISRTPVHRALAELAEDGAIFRHRRRGTLLTRTGCSTTPAEPSCASWSRRGRGRPWCAMHVRLRRR
jgi:multiple sugar transport system substrate-binding protein